MVEAQDGQPIRIQLLSDLHLEIERVSPGPIDTQKQLYHYDFPVMAPVLALLGDIGMTVDDRLFDWLRLQLTRFKLVLFVSGNHEPYWSSIDESQDRLEKFAEQWNAKADALRMDRTDETLGRFVFLNRTRRDLSSTVTVLGCTLWSHLNPDDLDILQWSLTDFKRISGLTPESYQSLHAADLAWLKTSIAQISRDEPHRQIVVMTHQAPTVDGTSDPKFVGGPTASAFATELLLESVGVDVNTARVGDWPGGIAVKVWMFGHTHWSCDFERAGVRVVSNQRGYKDRGAGFVPDKVIEI